jgi:hypothetical protein
MMVIITVEDSSTQGAWGVKCQLLMPAATRKHVVPDPVSGTTSLEWVCFGDLGRIEFVQYL